MGVCEVCHNEYEKTFTVELVSGEKHVFDCMECAIQIVAPECPHCKVRVIGHGVDANGQTYCCDSCVRQSKSAPRSAQKLKDATLRA